MLIEMNDDGQLMHRVNFDIWLLFLKKSLMQKFQQLILM